MMNDQAIGLLLTNSGGGQTDVTDLLWPNYSRESGAIGGDLTARSSFDSDLTEANKWLERLGWELTESYSTITTWRGKISKVLVDFYGQTVSINLKDVFNSVVVVYKASKGVADSQTPAAIDQASINRYGKRELVYRPRVFMSAASANSVRDGLLVQYARPSAKAEQIATNGGGVKVNLEFDGLIKTLQAQNFSDGNLATIDADAAIIAAVAGATEISAGNIEANSLQMRETYDIDSIWSRLKDITDLGDGSGELWLVGAYASNELDYFKPDLSTIHYFADLDRFNHLVYYDKNGNQIAPALIKPGKIIFRRDLLAGRPVGDPLLTDPRALLIGSIRFSRAGAQIKALNVDNSGTWQAIINQLTTTSGGG